MTTLYDPQHEELVHLAGDFPPNQQDYLPGSPLKGYESTVALSDGKTCVQVRYEGKAGQKLLEVDVYAVPGSPLKLHLFCPQCHNLCMVHQDRTPMDFDPSADVANGGRLSVQPFTCTWELDGTKAVGISAFGSNLCRLKIAIDHNRARDVT